MLEILRKFLHLDENVHQDDAAVDQSTNMVYDMPSKWIYSIVYKAHLHEIYSEASPAQARRYKSVLSNLQNALSLLLRRRRIFKGSPFQMEGPTLENTRRCLVASVARGTNSWPVTEERRAHRPGRPDTSLQSSQR